MAFMGILFLNAVLMAMLAFMGLGILGLAVLGGLLALAGAVTLVLFLLMLY